MPGSGPNRPPPGSPAERHHWWHRPDAQERKRAAADRAYESSAAGEQERLITEALADLRDMDVREVMTPRADVVTLTIPVTAEDVAQAVRESGHSCFPVVNDDLDDVVGLLFVNDLFRFRSRRSRRGASAAGPAPLIDEAAGGPTAEPPGDPSPLDISRRLRQPYVIPESRRILEALVEMRRQRRGFAVVGDEYGGVAGVLTIKDLLEPIVGDLHDEFDPADDEPEIVRVDGTRWLIDGRASVDDVRDRLGLEVPDGDYVTLAGFLLDGFGHIPEVGEVYRTEGWELQVQEMDKRRIVKVVVRQPTDPAPSVGQNGVTSVEGSAPVTAESPSNASRGRG